MKLITSRSELLSNFPECYACEEKSTGVEHAPPRLFFPEGGEYRKDLITVPSCDLHNAEKSRDDVYAAWHITDAVVSQNECADLVKQKLDRMIKRDWNEREGRFARRLIGELKEFDGMFFIGELDGARMVNFMRRCSQAVYFHEKLKKLRLPLNVANLGKDFRNPRKAEKLREIERSFAEELQGCERHGSNPEVFEYAIWTNPTNRRLSLR